VVEEIYHLLAATSYPAHALRGYQNKHAFYCFCIFVIRTDYTEERGTMKRIVLSAIVLIAMFLMISADAARADISPEGAAQLEADWLFQCDNTPTLAKAKQEIVYAREMAARIAKLDGAPNLSNQLAKLDAIEKKIDATQETEASARELYIAIRYAKRAIAFANPLVDFDQVVLIDNPYPKGKAGDVTDEWGHEARHRNGFMAVDGGKLLVVGLDPGSPKRNLFEGVEGSFWRPDVHFDGKKVLVSFQPEGEKSFHIYEVGVDGKNLKQLTVGDYDDLDPVYTPDGHITFCTSRSHTYVRCMPMTHAFAVARCDGDGKNIYVVSRNGEPEYLPSVLNDGRIIYTRWEYTDKALWRVQSLWTMNPDGTNVQIFWGNQSVWPDVLTEARAIPGSRRVMFTGLGHHAWFDGCIGIIDPDQGLDYPDGLTKVTQDLAWPEVGNGPGTPNENDQYNKAGNFGAYKTPYPLSEEYFLVSAREGGRLYSGSHNGWFFSLYLMDAYGNKELVYKGEHNAYHAMPLRSRVRPPAMPDRVMWPKIGSDETPAPGVLYSNNVFDGAPEVLKEKGKYIRVVQMDPKTYTTWHKTVQHDGPAVGVTQAEGVKRVLGTAPIEADGSVCFSLPSGAGVFFQMLDEKGQCIHAMRSFTGVMPGETRGCFGCHESKLSTRGNQPTITGNMSLAMRKGPAELTPPAWGADTSVSYLRFVQPVLDKHCGGCHQDPNHKAFAKLNMTLRPSSHRWRSQVHTRPGDASPFTEPYLSLVGGNCPWGRQRDRDNLAGIFIVEGYDQRNPENLATLPPYSAFSPTSTLIHNAASGEHNKVRVTGEDLERLIAWVDLNGPYLGAEEIGDMCDPVSNTVANIPAIRPRVGTAPVINRFNLRQDGDTMAMCGDLKIAEGAPVPQVIVPLSPEILKEKVELKILDAQYGAGDAMIDVTGKVQSKAKGIRYIELGQHNDLFGDPINGTKKTLTIVYEMDGVQGKVTIPENENVVLPRPKK